jgi:hypothetical protein
MGKVIHDLLRFQQLTGKKAISILRGRTKRRRIEGNKE